MLWGWSCAKKIKDVRLLFFYAHSITLIRHINNFGSEGNVLLITMSEHHSLRLRHIKGLLGKKKLLLYLAFGRENHISIWPCFCVNWTHQLSVVQGERKKKNCLTSHFLKQQADDWTRLHVNIRALFFVCCLNHFARLGDWLLSFTGVCVGVLCVYVGFGSKGLNPLFEIMHNRESQLF